MNTDNAREHLTAFWQAWCEANNIEPQSADEVLLDELTTQQRLVVSRFIELWDALA